MSQLRQRLQAAHLTPYFQAFWGLGDGHLCGWVWYLSISRFTCQLLANSPSQKAEVMLRQLSGFLLAQINTQCVSGMERSKCGWRTKSMWVWWRQRTKGHNMQGLYCVESRKTSCACFSREKFSRGSWGFIPVYYLTEPRILCVDCTIFWAGVRGWIKMKKKVQSFVW